MDARVILDSGIARAGLTRAPVLQEVPTMTTHTTQSKQDRPRGEDFTSSEGLRKLLHRLHQAGPGAWIHDPVAAELMQFTAEKYRALAQKHHLDPWEAVTAAFEVMRKRATREACDPWAVVTHAVRITCVAEERGQGMLCSTHQARRPEFSVFHDAERFADRDEDNPLIDFHPAFQVTDHHLGDEAEEPAPALADLAMSASAAMDEAIRLFIRLEWPEPAARAGIEHVCQALARAGSRQTAYEALRRDRHARALLDLPKKSWSALLKVLLGNPNPAYAVTGLGKGILLRLLIGETVPVLLRDDDLVLTIALSAPGGAPA